jgi:hypothetical protein
MRIQWSPVAFSVLFCVLYVVAFVTELPLVRYYPVAREWAWGATDDIARPGPVMVWYGLVATAALIAGVAAFFIPHRRIAATLKGWIWVWPCAAVVACLVLLRPLFL